MAVTEEARHDVYNYFQETMGHERAATLMGLLPPLGWGDIPTKQDIVLVRKDIDLVRRDIDGVRKDVDVVRNDLGRDIEALRQWAGQHFEHIEKIMMTMATTAEVETIRSTLYRILVTQTVVLVGAMVGIAGLTQAAG